ncbi:Na+/H+ antiporter subunit E [Halorarum halophilum]|uniref:Na+/H+ antiporter subunit E n=1 Tax=Halorarum halophilum TaxID=2743090 RepID=A0A7D5KPD9_9EURY|nr:Na+/H+ antiporter subunit E [Halobaculum halophilum]QLG29402.1 Na+/H+ antiporter subunit E [Halobaculum halophilum]
MMRRWIINALAIAVLWLFVRGVPLEATRIAEEGLIGLVVSLPIAFGLRRFYEGQATARTLRVVPYVLLYLLTFLKELLVANVEVARVVLSPSMPIRPAVVEVPLRVESDAAITTIANSLTLTPGTLTMDYDADANALYVHSIAADDPDDVLEPIRKWEDYALVIFDEELGPGDPVQNRGVSDE